MTYVDKYIMFKVGNLYVEAFSPRGVILTESVRKAHRIDEEIYTAEEVANKIVSTIETIAKHGLQGKVIRETVTQTTTYTEV
jgi:hypothetical protein